MTSIMFRVIFASLLVMAGALPAWAQSAEHRHQGRRLDKPALVFLVAGQSNANGCGILSPEIHTEFKAEQKKKRPLVPGSTAKEVGLPIDADDYTHSYIWAPDAKELQPVDPKSNLHPPKLDVTGHGMELPVVRELEKRFPENDIIVIKLAHGGTKLYRHWDPEWESSKNCYVKFMASYRDAMARLVELYPEVRVIGLYWDQGESDGANAADEYEENLTNFINVVRRETGIPELNFFIRKHIFRWPNIQTVIAAQLTIAANDPNCHVIDIGLGSFEKNYEAWSYSPKNPHLSSKGFVALAERLFEGPLKDATVESFDRYLVEETK